MRIIKTVKTETSTEAEVTLPLYIRWHGGAIHRIGSDGTRIELAKNVPDDGHETRYEIEIEERCIVPGKSDGGWTTSKDAGDFAAEFVALAVEMRDALSRIIDESK